MKKIKKDLWIVGSLIFVAVAVALGWRFSLLNRLSESEEEPNEPSAQVSASVSDTYFDNARYTRTRSRNEAIALLQTVVNDASVDDQTKQNAWVEIGAYAKMTEGETALENVLKAKGFSECIVFLTKDTATVVVASDGELSRAQSAQIFDAVVAQTGFESGSVRIVTYP